MVGVVAVAGAITGICCVKGPAPARKASRRTNLVLVVIDTLRRDHLPSYGYSRPTAPNLSRLAEDGAIADAISPTSWTKPAVASIVTGLHPLRHQTFSNLDVLPKTARTMAEILKAQGYLAVGATANGFVGTEYGFGRGFDEYFALPERGMGRFEPASAVNRVLKDKLPPLKAPFFLYLHYLDPHAPYEPMGPIASLEMTGHLTRREPVGILELEMENFWDRPRQLLEDARDLYDGEIRRVDDAIGEVVSLLSRKGLLDSTLLVVTSDHGEEMQEHGRMGHGQSLYEEVCRVPLIFWGPGVVSRGVHHGTTSLMDILPTALDLMGLGSSAGDVDGSDFAPEIRAGLRVDGSDREMLLHLDCPGGHYLALRTDSRKLVIGRDPYRKQLFDLAADRAELKGDIDPGRFTPLAEHLVTQYRALLRKSLAQSQRADTTEARQEIAALGYVAGGGPSNPDRTIPFKIATPDTDPGGLLGWEDPVTFERCVRPSAVSSPQLLLGWYPFDSHNKEGRFTWQDATVAFRTPIGERLALRLTGRSAAVSPVRAIVSWRGEPALDTLVPSGAFDLSASLGSKGTGDVGILRIRTSRATELPPRIGQKSQRKVGFLLSSVCVGGETLKNDPPRREARPSL